MPQRGMDADSRKFFLETVTEIGRDDVVEFLQSLLSSAEIKDISRRLMAAKLLKQNLTYEMIVEIMGMSESTIGKIHAKTHGSPVINNLFSKK